MKYFIILNSVAKFLKKDNLVTLKKFPRSLLTGVLIFISFSLGARNIGLDWGKYLLLSPDKELHLPLTGTALFNSQIRISGTVTDSETGEPLTGVSVKIRGTNRGVITDEQGHFSLESPNDAILEVSFIGYHAQLIPVSGRTVFNITLAPSTTELDQVIVVGYGTQRKSDLTGSISTVKGDDLTKLSTQRIDQSLQGRAAGVMVWNTDNAPGGNTLIRIRGMNSILGGNSALIVIDGLQGGDLTSINPNDVESIEILKDASATAIYGARGANGVILITTKSGKKGKPQINYSYDWTHGKLAKKRNLTTPVEYANLINEEHLAIDNLGIVPEPIFSQATIDSLTQFGGTDWQGLTYRTAITQNHQLGISGGTDNVNYFVSAGYLDQDGIIQRTGFKRYSLRAKLDAKVTDWLDFGLNWNGVKQDSKAPVQAAQNGSIIKDALTFPPVIPIYDADGNFSKANLRYGDPIQNNPMGTITGTDINNGMVSNNLNLFLEAGIIDGLTFRTSGNFSLYNINNSTFYNLNTWLGNSNNGMGSVTSSKGTYVNNTNQLNYSKTFAGKNLADHKLGITLVQETNHWTDWYSNISSSDFTVQELGINDLSGAGKTLASSNNSKRVIVSYLGRINYGFQDKYLLTATYRADGSSVFGKNNKWGYFPSIGVAWRMNKENFLKASSVISDLKLRGSWGNTGNQGIGTYATLAALSLGKNYSYNGSDDGTLIGSGITRLPNPDLKWETTEEYNGGIDLGLFNNRLTITADYYRKLTTDLLLAESVPGYVGITSKINNVGSMKNKGFELSVAGTPVTGVFNWNTMFNLSHNETTVVSLGATDKLGYDAGGAGYQVNGPLIWLIPGERFGDMYGWKYLGLWKTSEAAEALKYGQLPGDPHYFDKNEDGRIDVEDTTRIGNGFPKYIFGFNNEFSYKNFSLSFLIEGRWGNQIFNVEKIRLIAMNRSREVLNKWSPDNENSDISPVRKESDREVLIGANPYQVVLPPASQNMTSRWVEDGAYGRLKSVMFTYHLGSNLLSKMKIADASVSLSATNLITVTNYSGYDPEVSSFVENDAQLGTDYGNYPPQRTFSIKLNLTF